MAAAHLYQIAYSEETFTHVMPGFHPLDNRANLRRDWFEFDPIRRFWDESTAIDDNAFGVIFPVDEGAAPEQAPLWFVVVVLPATVFLLVLSYRPLLNLFARHQLMNPPASLPVLAISQSTLRMARKASCGISTLPTCFILFLPSF